MTVTALPHGVRALGLWAVLAVPVLVARPLDLVEHVPWGATALGLAALALAAACARRLPATSLLLAAAPGLAFGTSLLTADYGLALPVLGHLLGLRGGARQSAAACAALALAGSARVLWRGQDVVTALLLLLAVLLFLVVFPWLAGRYRLQRRALAEAGWARAARLETEQQAVAERAALRERAMIAGEMHDALGHELSLIALRAGALQLAAGLPERHREAAAGLRAATAEAVDRLHEIVDVLRTEDGGPGPAPGDPPPGRPPAPDLAGLLGRTVASGLAVRVTAWPAAPDAHTALRHRVLREALTNAARYAPGAEVTVACVPGDGGSYLRIASGTAAVGESGTAAVGAAGTGSGGAGTVPGAAGRVDSGAPEAGAPGVSGAVAPGGPGAASACGLRAPGAAPPGARVVKGGGSGLRALAGAVRAAGGRFAAGEREGGGHLVEVWLPARGPEHTSGRARGRLRAWHLRSQLPRVGGAPRAEARAPATGLRPGTRPVPGAGPVLGPMPLGRLVVAGVVAGAVLLGGGFGWYAYSRGHSVLDARVYADARPGTPYADLAPRLPARTVSDIPVEREPARPAGAACRYYRAVPQLFVSVDHFRLCFRDGRLVEKTVVPGAGVAGDARRELAELGG
ncbi:sensor histidine kinase [Streptomyces sp. SPB074]|uniref:sensor histidine kinase n=1 Tax=Streptomyces sp. (strain SPB074) TaxID=465543 RepID=UPI000569ACBE|nr:histidine kinase [Streptomyces sp. SPB074]